MNFEELSSQEFAADEGENPNISTPSHSSKRSGSRRKFGTLLLKKASSIRNVMMGKFSSSSKQTTPPLLVESSDDTESSGEIDEATDKDVSAGVKSTDPVTGSEPAEKSQSSPVPSHADKAPEVPLRNLEMALNPQPHMPGSQLGDEAVVPLNDDSPMEQLRLAPPKSVSAIEKRRSGIADVPIRRSTSSGDCRRRAIEESHPRAGDVPIRRSSVGDSGRRSSDGSCRRRGRRPSYQRGDSVPIIVSADADDGSCRRRGRRASYQRGDSVPLIVPADADDRWRSSAGSCRRRGRRASYQMGDSVPIIVPADADDSSQRGRRRTCSEDCRRGGEVDRRLEWRSKSNSRRKVIEPQPCGEKDVMTSNGRRLSLLRSSSRNLLDGFEEDDATTSYGRRLSLLS